MNVGTIVEADMLKVRLVRSRAAGAGHTGPIARGGRVLGEVEEYFIETMVPGDTFVFGGEILKYEAMVENEVYVSRSDARPEGARLRRRQVSALDLSGRPCPPHPGRAEANGAPARTGARVAACKQWSFAVPGTRDLLVETFPRAAKYYLVCYPFEGRLRIRRSACC